MSHAASQLWVYCKDCFTILHNEMGQERHGNNINGFSERDLTQSNLVILKQKWYGFLLTLNLLSDFFINFTQSKGPRGTWKSYLLFFEKKSHLWQFDLFRSFFNVWLVEVKIEPGHCYYCIFKQSGHSFPGKRLCGGLYLDIIWCLCMEVNIQHRVIWFCQKRLL